MRSEVPWYRSPRVLGAVASLLALGGTVLFANVLDRTYPLSHWLAWPLATIWGWVLTLNLAWLCFGQWLLARVLRIDQLPPLESAVLGTALGVVAFTELMYVGGALHLYGPIFACLLPIAMIAVGAASGLDLARRWLAEIRTSPNRGPLGTLIAGFGILCLGLIYLGLLSPDSINYDSTWCHLTVAQDYAREGRIIAFPGDYTKNVPQLASLIHTWGFSVPGLGRPALRWMMALHNEFGLFLWTLAGVAAAIRWLVNDQSVRGAWVSFFLFPIIFVYDNNLGGAADHVLAFFAAPLLLATVRLLEVWSWQRGILLAALLAGAVLTKYQAVYIGAPIALLLGGYWLRLGYDAFRNRRQEQASKAARQGLWVVPAVVTVAGLVLASPHFIRNFVFYNNPVYPFMQQVFTHSTPTVENGTLYIENILKDTSWVPKGDLPHRLWDAVKLFWTFSFVPHYSFTKNVPAFGSLFTLLLPTVLLTPERRRKLLGITMAAGALFLWAYTYNVDRNLQVFMPLMVAVTGALIIDLWRLGWTARLGLIPLVALQLIWGADAPFYSGADRIRSAIELLRSGYEGDATKRFDGYRASFVALGRAAPKTAKIVLHTSHVSLGINRELVLDWTGFQGLISYGKVHNPRELHDYYRSLGITHVIYSQGAQPAPSKQEDIVFYAYITRYAKQVSTSGGYRLMRLPDKPPPVERPYQVLTVELGHYGTGRYAIDRLNTIEYLPSNLQKFNAPDGPIPDDVKPEDVDAIYTGPGPVPPAVAALLRADFTSAVQYGPYALYLPKALRPGPH